MIAELQQKKLSNPSFIIYHKYESQILAARKSLFSSLSSKSDKIALAAEKILERKIKSVNAKNPPHLFEIFPWLLRDLTNLDHVKAHEIAINWLALYLYVSFLDDHLDLKTEIEPDEFIAASVLAQTSLINLFKMVDNTKYEELFKEGLFRSAKYELKDISEQGLVYKDSFTKAESATGKNAILLACACAVAASTEKDSNFIIDLTSEILLSVQLLDDLTDVEEDVIRGNITIPLNDIGYAIENALVSRSVIISLMLQSKSLSNVLKRIESSLTKVVSLIHTSDFKINLTNSALVYFQSMLSNVNLLNQYIESIESPFVHLPQARQVIVLKELENKLLEIYCHT